MFLENALEGSLNSIQASHLSFPSSKLLRYHMAALPIPKEAEAGVEKLMLLTDEAKRELLDPPTVKTNRKATKVDQAANVDWLKTHKNQYKGKWVAIKDGNLLEAADSYEELVARVGNIKGTGILTTKLY